MRAHAALSSVLLAAASFCSAAPARELPSVGEIPKLESAVIEAAPGLDAPQAAAISAISQQAQAPTLQAAGASGAVESAAPREEAALPDADGRQRRIGAIGERIERELGVPTRGGSSFTFPGWEARTFKSAYQDASIHYQTQRGTEHGPGTVFVGGVGLAESFDSLFATDDKPKNDRLFLVLRGNDPSPWVRTPDILDADSHDLARAITLAGEKAGGAGVHVAVHSYSTLAFQGLIQRREDPEVKKALEFLRGGQVTLVTGATLYDGHHVVAGDQYESLMTMMKGAVAELDAVESNETGTQLMNNLFSLWNPFNLGLNVWSMTRDLLLSESTMGVSKDAEEFNAPWAPEIDHIRRYLKQRRIDNAVKPDWQEALLRRTVATSSMNFTPEDVQAMRELNLRVDVVYAHDDQLIPWTIGQLLPRRLGMKVPDGETPPPAGTVLSDPSGLFRLHVVAGDHYFPLKHPAELKKILESQRASARSSRE